MSPDAAAQVTPVVPPAEPAAGTWTVVADECTARFRVRDKLLATTTGTIPVRAGAVRLGPGGAVKSARVELDVAGIDTGNRRRDGHLRTPGFLDAQAHPSIEVRAEAGAAEPAGWRLDATLSARGRSVPLALQVAAPVVDGPVARVRITGRLDRTGLGMKVPTFVVGRMIDIEVDAVFCR